MATTYSHIEVRREGDVFCVCLLRQKQLDDTAIRAMSDEIQDLIDRENCRKMVLSLGQVECLYSVLIGRLIKLRRSMNERGGALRLCDVSPEVLGVFKSCQLLQYFHIVPDEAAALESLRPGAQP